MSDCEKRRGFSTISGPLRQVSGAAFDPMRLSRVTCVVGCYRSRARPAPSLIRWRSVRWSALVSASRFSCAAVTACISQVLRKSCVTAYDCFLEWWIRTSPRAAANRRCASRWIPIAPHSSASPLASPAQSCAIRSRATPRQSSGRTVRSSRSAFNWRAFSETTRSRLRTSLSAAIVRARPCRLPKSRTRRSGKDQPISIEIMASGLSPLRPALPWALR